MAPLVFMDLLTLGGTFGSVPIVSCSSNIDCIDTGLVDSLFRKFGVVMFIDTGADQEYFSRFAERFGPHTGIRDVFVGRAELGWHAEYAYLPMRPAVLWFYCQTPAQTGGETRIVDGVRLARHINQDVKRTIDESPLQFNMRLSQQDWELWIGEKDCGEASAHFNTFAGMKAHVEQSDCVAIQYTTPAFHTTQFSEDVAFSNTLLHAVDDPEHYGLRMDGTPYASASLLDILNKLANCFAISIGWQKQQFLMIDNSRFMHSRASYSDLERNVKYVCTYRYQSPKSF